MYLQVSDKRLEALSSREILSKSCRAEEAEPRESSIFERAGDLGAAQVGSSPLRRTPSRVQVSEKGNKSQKAGLPLRLSFTFKSSCSRMAAHSQHDSEGYVESNFLGELAEEIRLSIASYLDVRSLVALEAARDGLVDAAFKERLPVDTLFRLKTPRPFTTWRHRYAERATARRGDLSMVPGHFRYTGSTRDRKGRVETTGRMFFDCARMLTCSGTVVHVRRGEDASTLKGVGHGNLCAAITPGAGKRLWGLQWKEKVERSVGAYWYSGPIRPRRDGSFEWAGDFTWLGRVRGTFAFVLEAEPPAACS